MPICVGLECKTTAAFTARKRFLPLMVVYVAFEMRLLHETFTAIVAVISKLALVSSHVELIPCTGAEHLCTDLTT